MKKLILILLITLSGCTPIIDTYWDYSWRKSFQNGKPTYMSKHYSYWKKDRVGNGDSYGYYISFSSTLVFGEPINFILTDDGYLIEFFYEPIFKKIKYVTWGTYKIENVDGIKYFKVQYFKNDGVSGPTIYKKTVSKMSGYFESDSLLLITNLFSNHVTFDSTYSRTLNPPLRYKCVPDSVSTPKNNWLIDNDL
ncbi:MAG: hypothetical protein LCH54_13560 [Bacteroidetes bacterium]|nr:hypothetical protein [Bacteroidota bacterium]